MKYRADYSFFLFLQLLWGILVLTPLSSFAQIDPSLLSEKTLSHFEKVPEFDFIIQKANKLGVKVYLFGGTASAFAHYVRWDLEREAGDTKYQKERFDYDFTNIYRGNQDLDIVVDGTGEQADELRRILQETYPHFMGDREAWEVRLLRTPMGDKKPLLDDYDFKNQHTDTNSTGMLALNPAEGEIVYRDLLDWENPESEFLTDVSSAKIKFLYNDKHETTSRFKEEKNPPVLAAIRYLAKLTQYEVKGTPEDLEIIKEIISKTNTSVFNSYVKKKAFEFGLKALLNAPDVEYAWNLLDETGARKLLMQVDGKQIHSENSLSWWFNKEPLRSFEITPSQTKTARDIFNTDEIIISHETNSFTAYENITRSAQGRANVFISRDGKVGEAAVHGDGFYTKIGNEGARETGLTIRFKLKPEAREGQDFIRVDEYIIVKNKNALELIQENLNISMLDYIKLLSLGELTQHDKGLFEKFNRKFNRASHDPKELADVSKYVLKHTLNLAGFSKGLTTNFSEFIFSDFEALVHFYMSEIEDPKVKLAQLLTSLKKDKKVLNFIFELINQGFMTKEFIIYGLSSSKWRKNPEVIEMLLAKNDPEIDEELIIRVLPNEIWVHRIDWIETLLNRKNSKLTRQIISFVLRLSHWFEQTDFITKLLDKNNSQINRDIITHILAAGRTKNHPEWVEQIIEADVTGKATLSFDTLYYLLRQDHWGQQPQLITKILSYNNLKLDEILLHVVLSRNYQTHQPEWIDTLLKRKNHKIDTLLITHVLDNKFWDPHASWVEALISRNDPNIDQMLNEKILTQTRWKKTLRYSFYMLRKPLRVTDLREKRSEGAFTGWLKKGLQQIISPASPPSCSQLL